MSNTEQSNPGDATTFDVHSGSLNFLPELPTVALNNPSQIEKWIKAVNDNFAAISSLPFLRGDAGMSIYTTEEKLWNNDTWTELGDAVRVMIYHLEDTNEQNNVPEELQKEFDKDLKKTTITISHDDYTGDLYFTIPYTFLDSRLNGLTPINITEEFTDYSCSLMGYKHNRMKWTINRYNIIPTLYFDDQVGQFCWRVNGEDSHIIAQGVQGKNGENSQIHIIDTPPATFNGNDKIIIDTSQGSIAKLVCDDSGENCKIIINKDSGNNEEIPIGSTVLVYFMNDDSKLDLQFGILTKETGSQVYVPYDASHSLSSIVNSMDLKSALKKINTIPDSSGLRGLFVPKDDGSKCVHMAYDTKNPSNTGDQVLNISPVRAQDIDGQSTPQKYEKSNSTSKIEVGYDEINGTSTCMNVNDEKIVNLNRGKDIPDTAPIEVTNIENTNNDEHKIFTGKSYKTDTTVSIKDNDNKITDAILSFIPSFNLKIDKIDTQSHTIGSIEPVIAAPSAWTIELPFLGYVINNKNFSGMDVKSFNTVQFTEESTKKNYITISTTPTSQTSIDYNIKPLSNPTNTYYGENEIDISCVLDGNTYRAKLLYKIFEYSIEGSTKYDINKNGIAEVVMYIKPAKINFSPIPAGNHIAYSWDSQFNNNDNTSNVRDLIDYIDNDIKSNKPIVKFPINKTLTDLVIGYPFMHYRLLLNGTSGKMTILGSSQGHDIDDGKAPDNKSIYNSMEWHRVIQMPKEAEFTHTNTISKYKIPPSWYEINKNQQAVSMTTYGYGTTTTPLNYPHIPLKLSTKFITKSISNINNILRSNIIEGAESSTVVTLSTQVVDENNIRKMSMYEKCPYDNIVNPASYKTNLIYTLYPDFSLYVNDCPVLLNNISNNSSNYLL